MSRIGRLPIDIPSGVQVDIQGSEVNVKGPKGELSHCFLPVVSILLENGQVIVKRSSEEPFARALHGTTRAIIQNMVTGVSTGFKKVLQIIGVGYRAELDGKNLVINVGFSHPVLIEPPEGIIFEVDTKEKLITVNGFNKELVGQVTADIRKVRPPEPYKGKGIRYQGERVRRKAGKAAKTML